jgi:hypothetical protein
MGHLLNGYSNCSSKIWELSGGALILAISGHIEDSIPATDLTPLEMLSTNHVKKKDANIILTRSQA